MHGQNQCKFKKILVVSLSRPIRLIDKTAWKIIDSFHRWLFVEWQWLSGLITHWLAGRREMLTCWAMCPRLKAAFTDTYLSQSVIVIETVHDVIGYWVWTNLIIEQAILFYYFLYKSLSFNCLGLAFVTLLLLKS